MWSHPFPQPCLEMSEETRKKKLAAAKKKLREYQQKNCPGTLAAAKMKKKSKTGRTPKAITSGGCLSEDVPKDHTVPVPACADVTVLPDGVTSPGASTESPQKHLRVATQQKQRLQAQLDLIGEGGQLDKEAPRFKLGLVEELESSEAMLEEHKCSCQQLAPLAAPSQEEPQREPLSSGTKSDYKCGESHQGLQEAMEKLKSRFLQVMEEKAALQERVDTLEHCCLLLSEETETIGAYIALYQRQSAVLKERYREKDEFIHQLVQDNEKLKVELLELQGQVLWLVDNQKERQGKFRSTTQSPAEELVPGLPMSQEFSTADQLGACRDVSLTDNIQPGQGQAGMGCTTGNTTTQPIMQLPREIQNLQELADIDSKPCLPFFYRAGGNNQVKILVV